MQGEWYEVEYWTPAVNDWRRWPSYGFTRKYTSTGSARSAAKRTVYRANPFRIVHVTPRGREVVDG